MKKYYLKASAFIFILSIGFLIKGVAKDKEVYCESLKLANIEALSQTDTPSAIGCIYMKKATCYVFDGAGHLVDKRKNQYPG